MSQVRNPVSKQIAKVGQQLGSLVAKAQKKNQLLLTDGKKQKIGKPKKKTIRGGVLQGQGQSMAMSLAPVTYGLQSTQGVRGHTPFIVSGSGILLSAATGGGVEELFFRSANGTVTNTNRFSLDPAGSGNTAGNFLCLQTAIRSICLSFVRYRWKKFKVTWVPTVPTSTAGSIIFAFSPEVITVNNLFSQPEELSCFERNFSTPVWQPMSYDALGHNGIDGEWYYNDPTAASGEADLRQESAGSIFGAFFGQPPLGVTLGYLRVEYAIELEGLANTTLFPNPTLGDTVEPKTKDEDKHTSTQQSHTAASQLGQCARPPSPEPEYFIPPGVRRYIPTM